MNTTNTSVIPAIGRVLMATIFVMSGIGKLFAPAATMGYIASSGLPLAPLALAVAIAVELGGGLLLALGIRTRLVAAALAAFSIVTGLAFHHAVGDQNQMIHLLKNIAMAGGLLQVVAFGAGAYSFDNRRAVTGGRQPA
ncbi:DoxX family protein [Duganella sp. BJB488]|uniref:DoxX family protein n=1 Tax=unclassified Duganella TaxID=2636909 RepID=UPI000E342A88|nr:MULTISPECIES: DoxX family protein [unclassified Duganella]NVD70048.1 DoxX family protein [Duganella sp. BJB1802]RFP23040.1 DoxX family protein [Duganella sp. BJB489]RFP24883.1 DoxX family protein [Duganella sp. BJB488]RFP34040.1 DoxX family protein [Duganella sp. BJB480]